MIMRTRNLLLTASLLLTAALTVKAQVNEVAMPSGLYEHGSNAGGASAFEAVDTVSVGAVMPYWVTPDVDIAGTTSTFAWTIAPAALGSQTAGTPTNSATITFGTTPTLGTVSVIETSPASCGGSPTTIDVRSIAVPTAQFGTTSSTECLTIAARNAKVLTLTPTLSTACNNGYVQLVYTITDPVGAVSTPTTVWVPEATGTIVLPAGTFTSYGVWTVTITNVNDRISIKSSVPGTITAGTYTYTVSKTPETGKIFHRPNI